MKALLTLSLLTLSAFTAQDAMEATNKLEQHEWLQQLVGEWDVSCELTMAPGAEPIKWESHESTRSIGDLWVVVEGTADNDGQPFTSLMTLGYDTKKETFVGSWIDTIQTTLWTYVGELDESKRVLTLEAEGPDMSDPRKTAKYRDRIELINANEKRMVSSLLGEDENWTEFLTVVARRVE